MPINAKSAELWTKKFDIYKHLLSVQSLRSVVTAILARPSDQDIALSVYDNVCKWVKGRSTPSYGEGVKDFFDGLAARFGLPDSVTGSMLIDATVEQFIGFLPEEKKAVAENALRLRNATNRHMETPTVVVPVPMNDICDDLSAIWLQHTGRIPSIAEGFQERKIDQRHYYLDPDSSDAWARIVDSQSYPTYDHCFGGLNDLFASPEWKKCLESNQACTAVMLAGGGAPDKDLMLIRNLLSQHHSQERVYHYLIDISLYMLRHSAIWLCDHLGSLAKRVVLKPIHRDVLSLTSRDRKQLHEHGKVIFAITGGTIGNLSESAFFRSLGHVAASGDLLIVSADTIDQLSKKDQDALEGKYDNDDLRLWLKPVVRAILSETNERETVDSALRRIKVELLPVGKSQTSDVSQSRSMVVTLKVDGEQVSLLTSTRYRSSELKAFASSFGWQPVCEIPSPRNNHFKQFLFQRRDTEESGMNFAP